MGARRKARELALKIVFESDFNHIPVQGIVDRVLTEDSLDGEAQKFLVTLLESYHGHSQQVDERIESFSEHWKLSRMASVDRNILRLGVSEILFCSDVPKNVSINEYLEIAKKYGNEESSSFINGILDKVIKP